MRMTVVVQNIEEMRRREGIDDVELRKEIRSIKVGDLVRLTLLSEEKPGGSETVVVRVTKISGTDFSGDLVTRPTMRGLTSLPSDLSLDFSRSHIHSLKKGAVNGGALAHE